MLELEIVRFNALLVCPWVTESVALDPRFDAIVKLSVVAVTVSPTEEFLCLEVELPLMTKEEFAAAIFGWV